ncbi:stage V sporulation protein K [Faecalibacterium sp. An77]|uniref:AAA family ATPase n=1 Tax=unclassified Faecalibacterium TaxID=2646395 RepID=UPI000B38F50E|nr:MULTISPECIES: AAA family ATPase [unclassified Faecalibacterium]OUN38911.1 stage V sporulation protein K [Faecalibacterium sp. An77]OUP28897.1 stage V sporulation protein K [Faecalibacterium sp. An192]
MGYNDDWESLMNSVFGSQGRVRSGGTAEKAAKEDAKPSGKPAGKAAGPRPARASGMPDLNKALQEQQKTLDALLKKQNAALRAQDQSSTRQALEESRQLLRDMEADGLLARGTSDTPVEHMGSFEGLAAEVKKTVLGQDAYVDALVRAMRRPFVLGTSGPRARNVILLWGPSGTGRHFALAETARLMAARGLLQSDQAARMDLALYADPGAERLFLQDLYAALYAPGEMVLFDHYERCCPAFLKTLASLAVKGSAPLTSRYLVNREGILVDAGSALAPGAVSRITPQGKYLIFFSHKGRDAMADLLGAGFVSAIGDVCQTQPFTADHLQALAAQQINELARRCLRQLKLTLTAGADVRDYVADFTTEREGAAGLAACCDQMFRALSEYCLRNDSFRQGSVALDVQDGVLRFSIDKSEPAPLLDLLPPAWNGDIDEVRRELDALVGLKEVKEYVFGLADNVQVQKRRADAGMKTASLSMHMIFTGNPGTGKTTIARLVARYLKAIGALRGGQLVEVSRGDLVGRYTGHTAPLTNSVIESALGGVLFIDEAYSLYRGEQDSFGLEAIDTLVKGMEDHRDDLVVILAGYTKEMQQFLTANSGLASRFPNQIEFPDYTADQLLDITAALASARGYRLDEQCTFPLLGFYQRRQAADSRTAGNGRLARNTLERAIYNQSRRLVAEPDAPLDLILPGDLDLDDD